MDRTQQDPKVTVCVITHNQQRYIGQCLQSIVDQNATFVFDVVVGDDCSTDGTAAIVQKFAEDYPGVVKPMLHKVHVGGTENYLSVHRAARGEYIAHVDGDDYMLPGKLQIQADQLDANPDCAMCVHEVLRLDDRDSVFSKLPREVRPRKSDVRYLLMNLPFFMHSSKMYRRECNRGLENVTGEILDCFFHVHHAMTGDILYLDAPLGVYRMNVGVSSDPADSRNPLFRAPVIGLAELCCAAVDHAAEGGVEPALIAKAKANVWFTYAYTQLLAREFSAFQACIKKSLEIARIGKWQALFGHFAVVPRLLFGIVRLRVAVRTGVLSLK
jgi:glycosyltransferase involved in cell wall biosynthesis